VQDEHGSGLALQIPPSFFVYYLRFGQPNSLYDALYIYTRSPALSWRVSVSFRIPCPNLRSRSSSVILTSFLSPSSSSITPQSASPSSASIRRSALVCVPRPYCTGNTQSSCPDPGPETNFSPTAQVVGQVYDNSTAGSTVSYFAVPTDPERITDS